jgi:hypothetical protein
MGCVRTVKSKNDGFEWETSGAVEAKLNQRTRISGHENKNEAGERGVVCQYNDG